MTAATTPLALGWPWLLFGAATGSLAVYVWHRWTRHAVTTFRVS